jgi:rhodanese-related sulfurtransferase
MDKLKIFAPILIILACVAYLVTSESGPSAPKQDPRQMIANGGLLLDVRTVGEYNSGHVANAVNIPESQLSRRLDELGKKDRPIVVYCQSGKRSHWATELLQRAGFTNVHDLGPMSAWPGP